MPPLRQLNPLPRLQRWLKPVQELRIDVESPSATPAPEELEALYARLRRPGDALFEAPVLGLQLPGLRVHCRQADGEYFLYVEDVQAGCLAGYTVLNRLVEVDRRTDPLVRSPHTKLAPAYQRRGIASELYRWALGQGICLLSGARQSAGAHALWHKLAAGHPLYHVALQSKSLQYLGPSIDAAELDALHTRMLLLGHGWSLERFAQRTRMQGLALALAA